MSLGCRKTHVIPVSDPDRHAGAPPRLITPLLTAALLALAAVALRLADLNRPLFLALNHALLIDPAPLSDAIWASLSVLGLGVSAWLVFSFLAMRGTAAALQALAAFIYCLPIGGLLTHGLKRLFAEARPAGVLPMDQLHVIGDPLLYSSMPSGHSVTAFAVATVLLGCWRHVPLAGRLGMAALCAVVALSRVATAAHWPADVLAGASLGVLTGVCGLWLAHRSALRSWLTTRRGRVLAALAQGAAGIGLCLIDTGYPQAIILQWSLGLSSVAAAGWRLLGRTDS